MKKQDNIKEVGTQSISNIQSKNRHYFLDLLKSIAIFLVIIYHIGAFLDGEIVGGNIDFTGYVKYYLRAFMAMGVPIFFFVNGALKFERKFDLKKHLLKMLKLICLTIFWVFCTFIIISVLRRDDISIIEAIKSIWVLKFQNNNHLWFLYTLVVLYIFFPLLKLAWDNNKKIFYFFLIVIFVSTIGNKLLVQSYNIVAIVLNKNVKNINTNMISLFNPVVGIYGYSLVYFMLGAICFKYKEKLKNKKYTIIAIISIFVSPVLLTMYWLLISKYTNKTLDYVWSSYDIIFTLINVISIFIISMNYKENDISNKIVNTIGSNTLGIYLIHMVIINILKYPMRVTLTGNAFIEVIWSIIIMLISLMLAVIIKKIPIIKNAILM